MVIDVPDYEAVHNCLSLKRKALLSSETSVTIYQPTFRNIAGNLNFQHLYRCILDHRIITFIFSEPRLDTREIKTNVAGKSEITATLLSLL